ncbi:hypothetical protein E2320_011563, partial [Naja naja]
MTTRMLPRVLPTSDAPTIERTTLKTKTRVPTQTKELFSPDSCSYRHMKTVIAGGIIGFLFAIFLILLLVYRMRKKDEGSYDLGERKPSSAAYQKAPTKDRKNRTPDTDIQ